MPNIRRRFVQIHFANVDAIEQDLAALDVVEAQQTAE